MDLNLSLSAPVAATRSSPQPTPCLCGIPVEILRNICQYLDNRSLLMLACAWKWFLNELAPCFDPQHPYRKHLQDAIRNQVQHYASRDMFQRILRHRFLDGFQLYLAEGEGSAGSQSSASSSPFRDRRLMVTEFEKWYQGEEFQRAWIQFSWLVHHSVVQGFPVFLQDRSVLSIPHEWMQEWSQYPAYLQASICVGVHPRTVRFHHVAFREGQVLAASQFLASLDISVPTEHLQQFVGALEQNTSLRSIKIIFDRHQPPEMRLLERLAVRIQRHPCLQHLNLEAIARNSCMNTRVLLPLLTATLKSLQVTNMRVLDKNEDLLADWDVVEKTLMRNRTLCKLELQFGALPRAGMHAIGRGLGQNRTLQILTLTNLGVGATELSPLAEALKENSSLLQLHLHGNPFGDEGVQMLAQGFVGNRTLQHVSLAENGVGLNGIQALLGAFLQNQTLAKLRVEPSMESQAIVSLLDEFVLEQEFREKIKLEVEEMQERLQWCLRLRKQPNADNLTQQQEFVVMVDEYHQDRPEQQDRQQQDEEIQTFLERLTIADSPSEPSSTS